MSEAASRRLESSRRGQSFVEFALVLPMLIVLLLGLADLGRVFSAGITIEAAARNAAEAVAQEYLQLVRNKTGGVLDSADYDHLRSVGLDSVCSEAETLADADDACTMPAAWVCVHDDADPNCTPPGAAFPADCDQVTSGWNNVNGSPGAEPLPYVEVRVCYRFQPIYGDLSLPFDWGIDLGAIWLQRERTFSVANY